MATNILMPALSPTMTEGTLARWLKKEGETIKAGDVIAEIETDKATMEVEAVDEGVLGRILVQDGTEGVKVNDPIAVLVNAGEAVPEATPAPAAPAKAAPAPATTAPAGDPNDPKAAHASGIYLYQTIDGKPKMTLLALSRIEDVTSGSGWGMAFGASSKTRAVIAGAHAELQIPDAEPVFYFYFPKTTDDGLGSADVSATSPDDYALGVLEAHTSHDKPVRRIEISKVSMGGYHMGLNPKDLRPFTSEKIADGAYKVTPNPLKSGEYVFVQLAGTRMMTTLKTYDFGIAAGK